MPTVSRAASLRDGVVHGDDLADPDLDRALLRREPPRQAAAVTLASKRTVILRSSTWPGPALATCVVPAKPVVRQNQS